MVEIFRQFKAQMSRNSRPGVLFVTMTGKATDSDILPAIAGKFRAKGIKVWAYGINPKANTFLSDLKKIATNPSYVVYGPKRSLVTPERFAAIENLIKQGTSRSSLFDYSIHDRCDTTCECMEES